MPVASRHRPRARTHLLVGLLCLVWGSTWLVIREGLADIPPFTAAAARFLAAAILMLALAPRLARVEGGARPDLRMTLVMGVLNFGVSYAVVYWTETILPSGLVCVLWSTFPMMLALISHVWLPEERLVGRQWLGLAGGFLGIVLFYAAVIFGLLWTGEKTAELVVAINELNITKARHTGLEKALS